MRFIRPAWLTHSGERKDFEIYSCHVSPDGSRLVTAAGDGFVRVWSTEAIYNAADPTFNKPKQLASMSYHTGTIHSVRFSSNGQYLASGADDKLVVIYKLDHNAPTQSTFGSNEAPQIESWRVFRRLIGHENDVQDLGWSCDSSIMVTVGLDSKVVVWSGFTFEKLKTLSGHQSHVKGITFDPANKYFATASDDRTVKIWRFAPPGPNSTSYDQMNNFMLEKTVTAPFTSSPLTTYFRRCSWSPDGNHIVAANAVNGPVSSVAVINRGTWESDINLIGHEGPTEVCDFSPRLFSYTNPADAPPDRPPSVHTVIACGGQDKTLSIWITTKPRPLAITQEIASKPIADLAWTPNGRTLFIASLDGTMICAQFEEGELGYPMQLEENDRALAKFGAGRKGAGLVEGPDGLLLEEKSKEGEMRGVENRMGALMGGDAANVQTLPNGSVSELTKVNGTIGLQNGDGEPREKEKAKEEAHNAKLDQLKNRITITKEGKKRITPLLVSAAGSSESSLPKPQLMRNSGGPQMAPSDQPQSILDLSKPFDGLPPGGLAALLLGNKRRFATSENPEEGTTEKKLTLARKDGATPIVTNTPDGLVPAKASAPTLGQRRTPEYLRPAVTNPSLTVSQVRLAVPKVRSHIVRNAGPDGTSASGSSNNTCFEARNPTTASAPNRHHDQEPCRITVTKSGQPIFQDYVPRNALLVTGSNEFWAVACEDGSIYPWTPAGRRLTNAIILESQPVILESQGPWLLAISATGMCYVWNMTDLTSPHAPASLAPVLDIAVHSLTEHPSRAPAVTSARLNSEGRIVVTLTNGEGYGYNSAMFNWQRLSEPWWMIGSQYWNTTDSSVGNIQGSSASIEGPRQSSGIVSYLERSTTNATLAAGRARFLQQLVRQLLSREGFEGLESSVSIAHLENRVAAALMLGAKEDFQVYLYMYAKRIGAEGLKLKVGELLRSLMGASDEEAERLPPREGDRFWGNKTDAVCGWPRQELLKGVILILGKHRDLQRITVPYAKILGITDETSSTNEDAMAT